MEYVHGITLSSERMESKASNFFKALKHQWILQNKRIIEASRNKLQKETWRLEIVLSMCYWLVASTTQVKLNYAHLLTTHNAILQTKNFLY